MSSSTSQTTSRAGRLTLPVEKRMDAQVAELLERLQADAVRNSDGTELPEIVNKLATKIYQTYFVGRGDQVLNVDAITSSSSSTRHPIRDRRPGEH